jgi:hypothetical protein
MRSWLQRAVLHRIPKMAASSHPRPTLRRYYIATEQRRVLFDANIDEVPAMRYRSKRIAISAPVHSPLLTDLTRYAHDGIHNLKHTCDRIVSQHTDAVATRDDLVAER